MTDDLNEPQTEDEIAAALADLTKIEAEAALALKDASEQREAIARAEREAEETYRAKMQALRAERIKLDEAKWDEQRAYREAQRKRESLERRLLQAKLARERADEWATLEDRWDRMTMRAPWREWAKDHQISGAKKMTYEGDMILGDTMGLGKTLTALIAIDMIEAATKDASFDNPIQFGSMK